MPDERERELSVEAHLERVEHDLATQLRIVHTIGLSSRDFIYVFDRDFRFIYVSPPLLKLWGKTLEAVVGKNFGDLGYPAELVALHQRQLEEALTGTTVSGTNAYVNYQGVEGTYEYTFVPVSGADGRVETIVGTTRDITERVKLERDQAAALAQLRESEAQFRQFADAIPQLAWMARADGHIYWYNKGWYEYTGTTPTDMEGWGWERVHEPGQLAEVVERWRQSLATGAPFEMSFPLRRADGRYRLFLTRVQPVRSATGELVRWFGTNTDIEAQRETLAEREAALAAANEASRAKDDFLAMLGHELRNPLSPIVTALKLLEMRGALGREHDVITRQVQHLTRLVDDLLDVARIARGKIELRRSPIEVVRAVLQAAEMASPLLEQRGQRLSMDVASTGLIVSADPDRLAQALSNLLTNACRFSDPGAEIVINAEREGDLIRILVRDHGLGVEPEMLERIFESFVQQRQAIDRARGGLGLGLSIVKNLVKLHGGAVYARSEGLGKGSQFIVELPAWVADTDAVPAGGTGAVDRAVAGRRRSRVLVVDDNADAADLLADFLRGLGFEVSVAHDPAAALQAAESFQPETALLDIGLPVMDGWELGRRLRGLKKAGPLKLIAITGYGQEHDRQESFLNGFAAHLIKPVDLTALTKLVCA